MEAEEIRSQFKMDFKLPQDINAAPADKKVDNILDKEEAAFEKLDPEAPRPMTIFKNFLVDRAARNANNSLNS